MKHKICIDVDAGFGLKMRDEIPVLAEIGFDGCFTTWQVGSDIPKTARLIADCGLIYQSIHSPFRGIDVVWDEGKAGDDFIRMLVDCVRDCASGNVPIAVVHPIIGMDKHTPTQLGIERFGRLLDEAQKCGVTVAFENVEGFEYLELIKRELGTHSALGYCWDTGHEMCYNFSMDVPAVYGDRLVCTHLDDNMGMTDPNEMTWHDDSHLMPFDGVADWQGIADRLNRVNYSAPLTFELTRNSKPNRDTHRIYAHLDYEGFMRLAFEKAKKFAAMVETK
ncbi:MAG: sugar phosphate isomerase/epimerase [Clostridia bacterium]|nr:sugar phosphate isomerase/epimerase [Clostridia bacterium]